MDQQKPIKAGCNNCSWYNFNIKMMGYCDRGMKNENSKTKNIVIVPIEECIDVLFTKLTYSYPYIDRGQNVVR